MKLTPPSGKFNKLSPSPPILGMTKNDRMHEPCTWTNSKGTRCFYNHPHQSKQRSDKVTTKFMVVGVYAHVLAVYLDKVNNQLEKYKGRVWYTGKKSDGLSNQHMEKNYISKIPHKIESLLNLPDPARYTFHSFRWTSATNAADVGTTTEQLVDFYGWKNSSAREDTHKKSIFLVVGPPRFHPPYTNCLVVHATFFF